MSRDPMVSVVTYLRGISDFSSAVVTPDLTGREVGQATIYAYLDTGYQFLRDVGDRVYIAYEVYSLDRSEAVNLSLLVRRHLLRGFRDVSVGDLYFLDANDEEYPTYEPDASSREHVYCGVVSLYCVEN